jgi:hypothetical protein
LTILDFRSRGKLSYIQLAGLIADIKTVKSDHQNELVKHLKDWRRQTGRLEDGQGDATRKAAIESLLSLFGTIEYDENYDYKRERRRKRV